MKSHEASPSRSFSMGRSIFLCLIILVSTSQAFLLYQDRFPITSRFAKLNHHLRRAEDYDNPPRNEIQETQQPSFWSQLFKRHDLGSPRPEGDEELLNNVFRLRKRSGGSVGNGDEDSMGAIFRLRKRSNPMGIGATFRL